MDFVTPGKAHDWSLVAYGSQGSLSVSHNKGMISDQPRVLGANPNRPGSDDSASTITSGETENISSESTGESENTSTETAGEIETIDTDSNEDVDNSTTVTDKAETESNTDN